VGTAIARTALKAGYAVNISGSGPASDIALLVEIVAPGAHAMTAADAAASADIVVVAVPLHKYRSVSPAILAGKIVIDTMNYWWPIDGRLSDFDAAGDSANTDEARSSSEVISDSFAGARLVKTLNHIGYHELETDMLPAGHALRRALGIAGDDTAAVAAVSEMIDRFGFDPVVSGALSTGIAFQPGTPIFGGSHSADELRAVLAQTPTTQAA
jgi:predicted dinucleotide-binding enzyme